jgi:hypothetical protein
MKPRGLRGPFRYFGLASRVPFRGGLPLALGGDMQNAIRTSVMLMMILVLPLLVLVAQETSALLIEGQQGQARVIQFPTRKKRRSLRQR